MKATPRLLFAVILGTFFLSGVAGLLYQVVWTRYLALFLGHTSYAVIAVLAAFMGGLALGNAWLGAVADRVKRPLLFYAALEIGIGLFAVAFPRYYELVHGAFLGVVRGVQPTGLFRLSLQFGFAAISILLPAVLMGATLPALTRFVTRSLAELRGRVAALYAINSSGAVIGTILADWWLIPELGLELTVYLGASISLLIGAVTLLLSRQEADEVVVPALPLAASGGEETFTARELRLALIGIGVSGFVAMLYEVAWTRVLGLALGSSTHAYSLMLATFISGIAVGGWIIYRWRHVGGTLRAFAQAELALGLSLAVSLWFYDLLPWWFAKLADLLQRKPAAFPLNQLFQTGICFAVMFVPTVFLGMTLPLASRIATQEVARTGRSVGLVFAVNTLGTVLGAVLTGFVLLPQLGLAPTFALGIGLNLAIGAVILSRDWRGPRWGFWLAPVGGAVLALLAAVGLSGRWNRSFTSGLWRAAVPPATAKEFRATVDAFTLEYHRDGAGSSVTVVRGALKPGQEQLFLKVNGKTDATSRGDLSTQVLLAQVPLLLHPRPEEILIVGLGSGVTAGSALRHDTAKRVEVVEISPEVVEATRRHFSEVNGNALADPRVTVALEDARTYLQVAPGKYDVIITEPSNPWMAGVAAVFSREFYEDCRARLKPGGLVAQWVQAYESSDRVFDIVAATFTSVFPYTSIWQTSGGDLMLVGSPVPFSPDLAQLSRRAATPRIAEDLHRAHVQSLPALLSLELLPFSDGAHLPEPGTPLHSDFNPVLEYAAQAGFFNRGFSRKAFDLAEVLSPRPRTLLGRWRATNEVSVADVRAATALFFGDVTREVAPLKSAIEHWMALEPQRFEPQEALALLGEQAPNPATEALRLVEQPGFAQNPAREELIDLRAQASLLMVAHRSRRSAWHVPATAKTEQVLAELIRRDPDLRRVHRLRLAELKWDQGRDTEFLQLTGRAFAADTQEAGPYGFTADRRALSTVLVRMFDLFERQGNPAAELQLLRDGLERRFFGDEASYRDLALEVAARRVAAKFPVTPPAR